MENSSASDGFMPAVAVLVDSFNVELREYLDNVSGLQQYEVEIFHSAACKDLSSIFLARLTPLLLLELNAARLRGQLTGDTAEARWRSFLGRCSAGEFWPYAFEVYPALPGRLRRVSRNALESCVEMAQRFVLDRDALRSIFGALTLTDVETGLGDGHRGGRKVARFIFGATSVLYKPRPLDADAALAHLLDDLQPEAEDSWIRVPAVYTRSGYGWAEFVEHAYCTDSSEEADFYRAMGAWVAVMVLIRGTDLHFENVIACGAMPVVVDCETLFTPPPTPFNHGMSLASVEARKRMRQTGLTTGLLPWRSPQPAPGRAGVDLSALGALPEEQPAFAVPMVQGNGSDDARLVVRDAKIVSGRNHPVLAPQPERYKAEIIDGFRDFADRIGALDRAGKLESALQRFARCEVRLVTRATRVYYSISRALWHPSSLRDECAAVREVVDLLVQRREKDLHACCESGEVRAEIEELLYGDIPIYIYAPEEGIVAGAGRLPNPEYGNQLDSALSGWRNIDLPFQEAVINASFAGAVRDAHRVAMTGQASSTGLIPASTEQNPQLKDSLRKAVERLAAEAIRGTDGSVTWIGRGFEDSGSPWGPVSMNLYNGQAGIVFSLAAYEQAVRNGHVEAVSGLDEIVRAATDVLVAEQEKSVTSGRAGSGGYTGAGGALWTWLALHNITQDNRMLKCAIRAAESFHGAPDEDVYDLLNGVAGGIVPLIGLAELCKDDAYLDQATALAELVSQSALPQEIGVCWPSNLSRRGVGGFSHGVTGIGWALKRLGMAARDERWGNLGDQAFLFEESLYQPGKGWRDLRYLNAASFQHAWCHGSTGIGLAALDLFKQTGSEEYQERSVRAIAHCAGESRNSLGNSLCHGLLGNLEFIYRIHEGKIANGSNFIDEMEISLGLEISRVLHESGPLIDPGLMTGMSGHIYSALSADRRISLPSPLTLEVR
ncbi:type 2 lanthipeptide synthetase LanM family protein [Streptomyces sp. NPDC088748]|uniref:type 2 lanthipeptide synthetase LanM family protein n=1 Tax=Streptomyces sp. NPDC088748 TaxID=3365887 RepID=UPI003810D7A1